jgi:hypothetical protein
MAPTLPLEASTKPDTKPALDDDLHLARISDAVALYGLLITTTVFLIILITGLCILCLGLVTTISGLTSLGLLIAVGCKECLAVLDINTLLHELTAFRLGISTPPKITGRSTWPRTERSLGRTCHTCRLSHTYMSLVPAVTPQKWVH